MNNLTEIKNHKVLYDGKDGKLLIPLNFGAMKEMVPWMQTNTLNRLKGLSGFPYIRKLIQHIITTQTTRTQKRNFGTTKTKVHSKTKSKI